MSNFVYFLLLTAFHEAGVVCREFIEKVRVFVWPLSRTVTFK